MNIRQKLYESVDSTNRLVKITNNFILSKRLNHIQNRKPVFQLNKITSLKKNNSDMEKFISNQNIHIYNKKLEKIKHRKIKPQVDTRDKEIVKSCLKLKRIYFQMNENFIKKENNGYIKRLHQQKSVVNIRHFEREYKCNRKSILKRIKNKLNTSLVLPPIDPNIFR